MHPTDLIDTWAILDAELTKLSQLRAAQPYGNDQWRRLDRAVRQLADATRNVGLLVDELHAEELPL